MNYIIQNVDIYVYALMFVRVFRVKLVFIINKISKMFSLLDSQLLSNYIETIYFPICLVFCAFQCYMHYINIQQFSWIIKINHKSVILLLIHVQFQARWISTFRKVYKTFVFMLFSWCVIDSYWFSDSPDAVFPSSV